MSAIPNYQIAGSLPFGAGAGALGDALGGGVGGSYTSAYNAALAQNQAQYSNILGGYQQLASNLQGQQQPIAAGYGQLGNQIEGTISGIGASQAQSIQDVYAQQSGAATQGLTNSGLGNSTVASSVQRGLTLDEQKAQIALANQMAQLSAGYQANIGMAGLGYQNQAVQQQQQLGQNQLGFMNSVNMGYPNAQSYQQLLQYQGAQQQYQDFMKTHPYTQPGVTGARQQPPVPPPSAPQAPQVQQQGGGASPLYLASTGTLSMPPSLTGGSTISPMAAASQNSSFGMATGMPYGMPVFGSQPAAGSYGNQVGGMQDVNQQTAPQPTVSGSYYGTTGGASAYA